MRDTQPLKTHGETGMRKKTNREAGSLGKNPKSKIQNPKL
jgi:hypothetical protein